MSTSNELERAQTIHNLFQGSAGTTKWLRRSALGFELSSAFIAACGVIKNEVLWGGWASLVLLLLMLASTGLRIWSRSTQSYSEQCRRVSARAFAQGIDVGAAVLSGLVADTPIFTNKLANMHPAPLLNDYYEPTRPWGVPCLQEIYAHSSFYSWRLLRASGVFFLLFGGLVACIGVAVIYGLAVEQPSATTAGRVLDVVCSVVFIVLSAKAVDTGIDALTACRDAHTIADSLLNKLNDEQVLALTAQYDMERHGGPLVPTLIYRCQRDKLKNEWHARRQALSE